MKFCLPAHVLENYTSKVMNLMTKQKESQKERHQRFCEIYKILRDVSEDSFTCGKEEIKAKVRKVVQ